MAGGNLFDLAEALSSTMFRDEAVFDRKYIPQTIPVLAEKPRPDPDPSKSFPGGPLYRLAFALKEFRKGQPTSSNIMLMGKTGTGKTLCTKCLLDELKASMNPELLRKTLFVHFNARGMGKLQVLRTILAQADPTQAASAQNETDGGDLLFRINHELRSRFTQFLLIIDEAAHIKGKEDFGETYYALAEPSTFAVQPVLLLIAQNNAKFLSMDPEYKDRLRLSTEIIIENYTPVQLYEIAKTRADVGLQPGVVDEVVLRTVGAQAYSGLRASAAGAINLLASAARAASARGSPKIEERDVLESMEVARRSVTAYTFDRVPKEGKALYSTIMLLQDQGMKDPTREDLVAAYNALARDYFGVPRISESVIRKELLPILIDGEDVVEHRMRASRKGGRPRFLYQVSDMEAAQDLFSETWPILNGRELGPIALRAARSRPTS